jgi:hypothetical protein
VGFISSTPQSCQPAFAGTTRFFRGLKYEAANVKKINELDFVGNRQGRNHHSHADHRGRGAPGYPGGAPMMLSLQQLATVLGGEVSGNQVLAPGPGHSPRDRSMSVKLVEGDYIANSFSGDDWKALRDYIDTKIGAPKWAPKPANLKSPFSKKPDMNKPILVAVRPENAEYIYKDAAGENYLKVSRYYDKEGKKNFAQSHWTALNWASGAPKGPRIPYRLPELLAAEHDTVFIVEGEKDADTLAALGLVATTNAGGAEKWSPDLDQYFKGREVYILPDNDEPGARHAKQVAERLSSVARLVRVVNLPSLPEKGDITDWLENGGTLDGLLEFIRLMPESGDANLIVSIADFLAGFVAPDYLLDGILQRRFIYSLTAQTGHGKTALALLIARLVGGTKSATLGKHAAEKGRVVYFAGENPDDLRMRVIGDEHLYNDGNARISFIPGTFSIEAMRAKIEAEIKQLGGVDLIIVDTSAAYFNGKDELSNTEMGAHARMLRTLTTLPGGPCVLVLCHPVKHVTEPSQLLPRGGGAFLAEIDGNITLWKHDGVLLDLHHTDKLRGPGFEPISLRLETVMTTRLADTKGRIIPTVRAVWISDAENERQTVKARGDEDVLLKALIKPSQSLGDLAKACNWLLPDGQPYKSKVQRTLKRLTDDKLAAVKRGQYVLTDAGKRAALSCDETE